jgi:hypothetical protein
MIVPVVSFTVTEGGEGGDDPPQDDVSDLLPVEGSSQVQVRPYRGTNHGVRGGDRHEPQEKTRTLLGRGKTMITAAYPGIASRMIPPPRVSSTADPCSTAPRVPNTAMMRIAPQKLLTPLPTTKLMEEAVLSPERANIR